MPESWKDTLRPASFRGVPFQVSSAETDDGRRIAVHQFPGREEPFVQDLGRRARVFSLEAFVLGPDYNVGRDLLVAALAAKGPGELSHPYQGSLACYVGGFRFRDSHDHGGLARFDITFQEAGSRLVLARRAGGEGAVDSSADNADTVAGVTFIRETIVIGVPEPVRTAAVEEAERAAQTIIDLSALYEKGRAASDTARKARALLEDAQTLITTPAAFVTSVHDAIRSVLDGLETAKGALEAYRALEDLRPLSRGGGTAAENGTTTANLVRRASLAGACRAAARVPYASLDEALEVRTDLLDRLDLQLEDPATSAWPSSSLVAGS